MLKSILIRICKIYNHLLFSFSPTDSLNNSQKKSSDYNITYEKQLDSFIKNQMISTLSQ